MALSPEQQAGLWRAKLVALRRDQLGREGGSDVSAPWGAGVVDDGLATLLLAVEPARSVGPALVLAHSRGAERVELLADGDDADAVASVADVFAPKPTVWRIDGTALTEASPATRIEMQPPPEIAPAIAALIERSDVARVVEHGELIVECRGLEVARVRGAGPEQRLEIGVGAYDQGAFAVMHPDLTDGESLDEVIRQVDLHRRGDAAPHPINRLARERWIRHELIAEPSRLALDDLRPVEGHEPRAGLHDTAPAFALGTSAEGERVLVACSVGIDLTLVPHAAQVAARDGAERIVLVLPQRDQHRVTAEMAERIALPCAISTALEPWPT